MFPFNHNIDHIICRNKASKQFSTQFGLSLNSRNDFKNFGFDLMSNGLEMREFYRFQFICFNALNLRLIC